MEQSQSNELETELISFKLQYKEQNVENFPSFKKWLEGAKKYVKETNKKNIKAPKRSIFDEGVITLTISFCNNCNSYSICRVEGLSSINCKNCHKNFCPGCLRTLDFKRDSGVCLKGFFKLLYIRMINGRSIIRSSNIIFNIIFIFIFLIFAPFHIGFISSQIGFSPHPNINSNNMINNNNGLNDNEKKEMCISCMIIFYSLFRGLLMFPYIITFLPFLVLILLPGIFSKKYFYRVMIVYWNALIPGNHPFKNLQGL